MNSQYFIDKTHQEDENIFVWLFQKITKFEVYEAQTENRRQKALKELTSINLRRPSLPVFQHRTNGGLRAHQVRGGGWAGSPHPQQAPRSQRSDAGHDEEHDGDAEEVGGGPGGEADRGGGGGREGLLCRGRRQVHSRGQGAAVSPERVHPAGVQAGPAHLQTDHALPRCLGRAGYGGRGRDLPDGPVAAGH